MAARKTARKKTRRRKPRNSRRSVPRRVPRLSELDQSHRDALGLALAGLGALFALVFYFGWDGGRVGQILSESLRFFFGAVAYLAPLVLLAPAAGLILQRGEGEEEHHRTLGVVVLGCALTLGYAAGTLGLGPPLHAQRRLFDPDLFMDRGGVVGDTLYWVLSSLFSRAGAHLAFVVAFAAGLLLTTGISAATLFHRGREFLTHGAGSLRDRLARERELAHQDTARGAWYSEPEGEPQVHALYEQDPPATHTSFAAEEEALKPDRPDPLAGVERDVVRAEKAAQDVGGDDSDRDDPTEELELTPMGHRRPGVTEADELD